MKDQLFRKEALQQLNVADRLDSAVQVVSAATALVVGAAAIAIATAITWAFVGKVPSRVYGDGLLLRRGAMVDVTSMADGQVQRVAVAVGDSVTENEPIAFVDQPELKKQQALLETKLTELRAKATELASLDEKGGEIRHGLFNQERVAVSAALRSRKKQLAFYKQKLESDALLASKGLATPAAVAETRGKVLELEDGIHAKEADWGSIALNSLESKRSIEERKYDLSMQVSETTRELEELEKRIDMQSVVLAKAAGRVIEIKVAEGDAATRGRPIATLEVASPEKLELTAVVYLPVQDGKRVRPGMPIKLAPSVVKPEEDGYIDATVDSVSPFPVSEQSMLRTVRNQQLVGSLLKDGPVYEAHVQVHRDPATLSGLRWSNGRGPATLIASGTPVRGLVTVRMRRPIELVIPAIERLVTDARATEP